MHISIKIHDIYLPRMKEICYHNNEIYLDFAMFMCASFEEMEKYINGNRERAAVMEELKNVVIDKNVPTYNYEEYLAALHKEVGEEAWQEGHQDGLQEGIKEGVEQTAIKLLNRGMSLKEVCEITDISIERLNELVKS